MIEDFEKEDSMFSFLSENCVFGEEDSIFSEDEEVFKETDNDLVQQDDSESEEVMEETDSCFVLDIDEETQKSETYRSKLAFGQYMRKNIGMVSNKKERNIDLESSSKTKLFDISYEVKKKQEPTKTSFSKGTNKKQMLVSAPFLAVPQKKQMAVRVLLGEELKKQMSADTLFSVEMEQKHGSTMTPLKMELKMKAYDDRLEVSLNNDMSMNGKKASRSRWML